MVLALLNSEMFLPELLARNSAHLRAHAQSQVQDRSQLTEKTIQAEHSCSRSQAGSSLQGLVGPYMPKQNHCKEVIMYSNMQVHKVRPISSTFSMSLGCCLAGLTLASLLSPLPLTSNRPGHSCTISSALSPVIGCTCDTPLSIAMA